MLKLVPLYICSFILVIISDKHSIYDHRYDRYVYRERFFYTIMSMIIIVFSGLRTNYNDTATYINGYDALESNTIWINSINWSIGEHPGFAVLSHLLKELGFSSQSFIMICSAFSIGVQLWFIHKYSSNISLSVYLFFTMGCFGFSMAAVKQCISIAICLIAIDREIQGKRILFLVYVLLAMLFHPFSLLFLIAPLLEFRPWTAKTKILIIASAIAGITMQAWLVNVIDMATIIGVDYDVNVLSGDGVNFFRLMVTWAPVILSLITTRYWKGTNKDNKANFLIFNLTMLNAELMLIALFGNPVYFGRLANYFLIFQTISLTWTLQYFEKHSRKRAIILIIIAYFGYCYYGNVINGTSFDSEFRSISLIEYLAKTL